MNPMAAANVIAPKPLLSLPLVRDDELAHHSCVLMLQNMAMIHVWEIRIGIIVETHQNTHAFSRRHDDDVLETLLSDARWKAVPVENTELPVMYVKRVRHHRDVGYLPNLAGPDPHHLIDRSEEHTSELQSLMRISYAVFCLKKKKKSNP